MPILTPIGWCHSSHNFWYGCDPVSEACANCYAGRDVARYKPGGNPQFFGRISKVKKFNEPLKWHEDMDKHGAFNQMRIFTCSWSDFFLDRADEWRDEAWEVIRRTPNFDWLILTKRPELVMDRLPDDWGDDGWPNVWMGYSVENQKRWEERKVLIHAIPARVKFLSIEPMLGPIQFGGHPMVDWIIYGGESGNDTGKWRYRETKLDWLVQSASEARSHQIPIFIKQYGVSLTKHLKAIIPQNAKCLSREGTQVKGLREALMGMNGTIAPPSDILTAQEYPLSAIP